MSSTSYLTICLNAVYPGWYKNRSYGRVWRIIHQVIRLNHYHYRYKIVPIPKPDGDFRKLGVPTPAWRIYLHGWNNLLMIWLHPYIPSTQHGYYPKRGCTTAWTQIYNEVLSSLNIYEFDLRKFFDNLNLDHLSDILHSLEIEPSLVRLLIRINRTAPVCGESPQVWSNVFEKFSVEEYHRTRVWHDWPSTALGASVSVSDCLSPCHSPSYYKGVSQGSPVSPLLSTLLLIPHLLLSQSYDNVQYADDGLLYNYTTVPTLDFPGYTGITVHPLKRGVVKSLGTWLKPLHFLGQTYVHSSLLPTSYSIPSGSEVFGGMIFNRTRTPKMFHLSHLPLFQKALDYDKNVSPTSCGLGITGKPASSLLDLFKSSYHGYLQSRLYEGSWDLSSLQLGYTLDYEPNSWIGLEERRGPSSIKNGDSTAISLTLYNASSYACQSLARRIDHTFLGRKMLVPWKRSERGHSVL